MVVSGYAEGCVTSGCVWICWWLCSKWLRLDMLMVVQQVVVSGYADGCVENGCV